MGSLTGTWALVKLAVRRDRIVVPIWIAVFVASAAGSASAGAGLFPTVASRVQLATTTNGTPMLVALYGKVYSPSVGALSLLKLTGLYACAVAAFAFILVIRHSRKEEETGRLEIVGSASVGRGASLAAAWIVTGVSCVLIGALSAASLVGSGLPRAGAVAFGLGWVGVGLAFAAVGGLAAQLSARARVCTGLAAAFLGVTYLVRAVGDASTADLSWLSWLSPIGWSQQLRPFAGERWIALVPTVVFSLVVGAAAVWLSQRRDLGAGILPDRPGRASARPAFATPLALVWRLERGLLIAWAVSFALGGLLMGSVSSQIGDALDTPQAREMIRAMGGTQGLSNAYLATIIGILGIAASGFGIQACLRLRSEEGAHRSENLLAAAVGRTRYLAAHLVVSFAGVVALLLVAGVTIAIGRATDTGSSADAGSLIGGALVQAPAALVMSAIPVALFGLRARWAVAAWIVFALVVLLGEVGPLVDLPRWALDLSPFAHVPRLPGNTLEGLGLVALSGVAVGLVAAGGYAYRRRDIA